MKIFALNRSRGFGDMVAKELQLSLSQHEERDFEDGEHKARPLENVRNQHVFVIHSLYSDASQSVNDKLCRLLFFIGALKDASAEKVTAVIPYLCYARKDRKTKSRDPVTTRHIARIIEAAGADGIVTLDVHNIQAFQNAFNVPSENLEARRLFSGFLAPVISEQETVIVSPDFGGIKRAEQLQRTLAKITQREPDLAFMEKYRSSGEVWGERISGEVKDKVAVIIDDLISTGGTIARAAAACTRAGATKIIAMASHGLFTGNAASQLEAAPLNQLVVTNTIPPFRLEGSAIMEKLDIVNVAPLFAQAIRRIHDGGSVTALLGD